MTCFRNAAIRRLAAFSLQMAALASGVAEIRLAGLFSDGAVLQRNQPVPVWGWAEAGEAVTVEFVDQTKTASAGVDGRWTVTLDPLMASDEPRALTARGRSGSVSAGEVLVGEVWLLSGQSNMAYLLSSAIRPSERDPVSPALAQKEISAANDPLLRTFRVDSRPAERPRQDISTQSGWMDWTPENGPKWAAMSYYFGKRLRAELGVPVGIVMCAWGGSGCSAWISAEALRGPGLRSIWPEQVPEWRPNLAQSHLFNGMLHPLAPFAIAGFGWYQGETEATPYHNPYLHRYLLTEMIQDWRRLWRRPDLPFYFIQLPNRDNEPRWVVVRESQAEALRLPGTVMIPTIDIGQAWDLHPRNKQDVAARFASFVLAREYGKGDWPGCPLFERAEPVGSALRLVFRDADKGFKTTDGQAPAEFQVAGEGGEFHTAEARIEGKTIVVSAPAVPKPAAVRYAWAASPRVNLVNTAGIAVPPFRSDDRPVDGQEKLAINLPVTEKLAHFFTGGSIATGKATGWQACGDLERMGKDTASVVSASGVTASILVRGFSTRAGQDSSPLVYWTSEPELDATHGLTLEAKAYVTRVGNDTRGFDLEAGLRRSDGSFRRYLVTVFPLRVHTFQNNPAPRNTPALETHVLRSDLDSEPAVYRLAVRPDGVAQIYRDQELLGTTAGEIVQGEAPSRSYLRIGKTVGGGQWATNIYHVAYDSTGAFAPAPRVHVTSLSNSQ